MSNAARRPVENPSTASIVVCLVSTALAVTMMVLAVVGAG